MGINLALRFILEICALLSLGYWGFQLNLGIGLKILMGIGAPLLAAVVWGTFGSPAAPIPIKSWARLLLEIIIFGSAALALYAAGKPVWAIVFVSLAAVNRVLMQMWDQA